MVDGHEHPAQREHQQKCTPEYLTELEPRCQRWVQMQKSEFDQLPETS